MGFHKRLPPVGARPGTLSIPAGSPPPTIHVFDYDPNSVEESEIESPDDLIPFVESDRFTWIDIQGFGDEAILRRVGEILALHPLTLEDATNVPQRAKSEIFENYQVIVARAPRIIEGDKIDVPQVCIILTENFVVTYQDRRFGFFEPVRERIRQGTGRPIRRMGPSYLTYVLIDTLIDHYFPIVEHLATELEELEDLINENPNAQCLSRLHKIRRELVVIRRVGWPQRESLRTMLHEESPFISDDVLPYLQHTENHAVQIMEAVDSSRDATSGLVDIYLSNVSNRTNEVMKVLTLMASIFIPLTFIAGIYGMNFENMPELSKPWGYPVALTVMGIVAVGMVIFFLRKGWIGSGDG